MDRNVNVITDPDGRKIVLVNDIRFKMRDRKEWEVIEKYLAEYVGEYFEIEECSEKIYIASDFPDEYVHSKNKTTLSRTEKKAKANAAQGIPELIQIATNPQYEENHKEKHKKHTKYGWYRYDVKFALPAYDERGEMVIRYNIYKAIMLVRHSENGKKYLYDFLEIKKETSGPPR